MTIFKFSSNHDEEQLQRNCLSFSLNVDVGMLDGDIHDSLFRSIIKQLRAITEKSRLLGNKWTYFSLTNASEESDVIKLR